MKYTLVHGGKDIDVQVRDVGPDAYEVTAFGKTFALVAHRAPDGTLILRDGAELWHADIEAREPVTVLNAREAHKRALGQAQAGSSSGWEIRSPMPGKIVAVLTEKDATINAGQGLVTVEAMKMENELRAPQAGVIIEVLVEVGQTVAAGAVLLRARGLS